MKTNKLSGPKSIEDTYPGLDYNADQLSKFLAACDLFTILLKNGEIIHFTALDKNSFYDWLINHEIEDIKITRDSNRSNKKTGPYGPVLVDIKF